MSTIGSATSNMTMSSGLNKAEFMKTVIYNSLSFVLFMLILSIIMSLFTSPNDFAYPDYDMQYRRKYYKKYKKCGMGNRNMRFLEDFQNTSDSYSDSRLYQSYKGHQRVELNSENKQYGGSGLLVGESHRFYVMKDNKPGVLFKMYATFQHIGGAPFATDLPKNASYNVILENEKGGKIDLGKMENAKNGKYTITYFSNDLPTIHDFKKIKVVYRENETDMPILTGKFL
jgi:hypothetical protein